MTQRRYETARARRKLRHDIYGVLIFVACGALVLLVILLDARPVVGC